MDNIEQLKIEVFGRQKILADIYLKSGSQSLFDYVSSWDVPGAFKEAAILAKNAGELLLQIYPAALANTAAAQLAAMPLVSTIDHHGILNHPFFINSNLIFSLKKELRYLICFSTSGVSLNNSSWPGSLLITLPGGRVKRFSFFSDKLKTQSVFSTAALSQKDIETLFCRIAADNEVLPEQRGALKKLLSDGFVDYRLSNFSSQASAVSTMLWSKIFPSAPQVVYLPIEDLVARLIIKEIVPDPGHILHKLLFTSQGWELIEKYFTGSSGAFTSEAKGSFLFWAVGKKGRRLHLRRQGKNLKGEEYCNFILSSEAVSRALALRHMYPTSMVCFLTLLYYGITCAGGFNQVNWLTGIKDKFILLLAELSEIATLRRIKVISTQNFAEGDLAFLPGDNGPTKATGIDLYLTGHDYYSSYQQLAKSLTVGESMDSLLPEIYRVITPAAKQNPELLNFDNAQTVKQNATEQKIKNFLNKQS